jgi:hypothetical protein
MKDSATALVKPKLTAAEKKISYGIDGLRVRFAAGLPRAWKNFVVWHQEQNDGTEQGLHKVRQRLARTNLSPSSINQKLSAVRRLATEAEDNALIDSKMPHASEPSKECRNGGGEPDWLTREEAQMWLNAPDIKH